MLKNFFRPRFSIDVNRIHVVSLSCNPVPPKLYGGIELVVAHLCEGLANLGAKVVCYSPGDLEIRGVEHFQTLREPSQRLKEGGVPNSHEHLQRIKEGLRLQLQKGDVVVFNHPDHYRYLKRRIGFFSRFNYLLCEVAHWVDTGMQDCIIYPSQGLQKEIGKPGVFIAHGEKLLFNTQKKQLKDDYLFFAGRITKDKGVDIALEACQALGIKLVLAGPLNDLSFSERIINHSSVEYLGELTYEQLFPYYSQAKALIYMTQYTEPFGLSVIEAMAAGCPVITTGKGGTGETVVPGKTGYFCQNKDEIVDAYHRLDHIDPADCVQRGKEYSIGCMAQSYLRQFVEGNLFVGH